MIFLALLVLLVLPSLPPTKKTTSAYRGGIFVHFSNSENKRANFRRTRKSPSQFTKRK